MTEHALTAPEGLKAAIRSGECVAFIGAGFSAPTVPTWRDLLGKLAEEHLDDPARDRVTALAKRDTARGLEAAAQVLADALPMEGTPGERMALALQRYMGAVERDPVNETRRTQLAGIPFQAIVTTNFDPLLDGLTPGPEAYLQALRGETRPWWHPAFWSEAVPQSPPVVKLHGDAASAAAIVLTQQDYRRRLYGDAGYLGFLRALMATRTILYLGFSFTDAYLNLIRSEVLAMLQEEGATSPTAYAVIPDLDADEVNYLRAHEGLEAITYSTGGTHDHTAFDTFMGDLHTEVGHRALLRRAVVGRTVLWVDPVKANNEYARTLLTDLMGTDGKLITVEDPADVVSQLESEAVDLVITYWGHGSGSDGGPAGRQVLEAVRAAGDRAAPTIVFASGDHAEENRRLALRAGATDYVWTWAGIFREIERVLSLAADRRWSH